MKRFHSDLVLLLFAVGAMAIVFCNPSEQTLASNDTPLGVWVNAQQNQNLYDNVNWSDSNWIGAATPNQSSVSLGLRLLCNHIIACAIIGVCLLALLYRYRVRARLVIGILLICYAITIVVAMIVGVHNETAAFIMETAPFGFMICFFTLPTSDSTNET